MSGSGGVVLVDSNADGNFGAMNDIWKMKNRRRGRNERRGQSKWNDELEKHDGETKNTMIGGCGVGSEEFYMGVFCV